MNICSQIQVINVFKINFKSGNTATRAKIAAMGAMSKVRGSTKNQAYPQTEGMLADTMTKYGRNMGGQSDFGKVLIKYRLNLLKKYF